MASNKRCWSVGDTVCGSTILEISRDRATVSCLECNTPVHLLRISVRAAASKGTRIRCQSCKDKSNKSKQCIVLGFDMTGRMAVGKCKCGRVIKRQKKTILNREHNRLGPPMCRMCNAKRAREEHDSYILNTQAWLTKSKL